MSDSMIENRRFYRLPSHARFVLGDADHVYSGKASNISFGGAFVHLLDLGGIKNGMILKCDFILNEAGPVLSSKVHVRRIAVGSNNPNEQSGVGVEFVEYFGDARQHLEEFILDQKRLYELLGTLLFNTEPDLRSIRPLIAKLPTSHHFDLRDMRVFVESTLRAIQMVEKKNSAANP